MKILRVNLAKEPTLKSLILFIREMDECDQLHLVERPLCSDEHVFKFGL